MIPDIDLNNHKSKHMEHTL